MLGTNSFFVLLLDDFYCFAGVARRSPGDVAPIEVRGPWAIEDRALTSLKPRGRGEWGMGDGHTADRFQPQPPGMPHKLL